MLQLPRREPLTEYVLRDSAGRVIGMVLAPAGGLCTGEAGPLAGVPFLLKDLGASLAGTREAMGSRALRKHVATESACTTEPSLFGPTVNPWSSSIAGWTSLANVTGWATISLPLGVTSQGLPIGVRLIPRRSGPASARRATRSRRAVVTSMAQYVMSPAWCETSVS